MMEEPGPVGPSVTTRSQKKSGKGGERKYAPRIRKGEIIPNGGKMVREGHVCRAIRSDGGPAGYDMYCGGTSIFSNKYENQFPRLLQFFGYKDGKYFSFYKSDDMKMIKGDDYMVKLAKKEPDTKPAAKKMPTRRSSRNHNK